VVSELPRHPRSAEPWKPEPLAGNYNECAQLSAVIIKADTDADIDFGQDRHRESRRLAGAGLRQSHRPAISGGIVAAWMAVGDS
jgi:hypothetical protein